MPASGKCPDEPGDRAIRLAPGRLGRPAPAHRDNMKDGVRIMNFARGELVNNEDLKAAINSEKVAKYVTDFPDAEVLDMKNTICYPHIGASTPESEVNCAKMVISEIKEYLENGNIINSVNYPNCIMEEFNGVRRIRGAGALLISRPGRVSRLPLALASVFVLSP